ncbi:Alpha-pyrone synthesis polyketide synthase-like Pks18 [Novipirellula galeiformis]|uniref:Alpha-pyrone synthesis polyketide synthase-like Pks18 n=1 Tax=Novipirellula galeiformis TaxID=2528004 RepID=A0A5C6CA14_9BACT|nr:type III polyketide synthase [Novipirellula galeiformis]TWU21038.1 Alpha-pyrone synthesis polyketide synthase-like Pks18 [Novipirellula galeiformis]
MSMKIHGIGTALPSHSVTQEISAEIANEICCETDQQRRLLSTLYRRTGVKSRHSVLLQPEAGQDDSVMTATPSSLERGSSQQSETSPLTESTASSATTVLQQANQTFYWPANDVHDRGPTTAQRLEAYRDHGEGLAIVASTKAFDQCDVRPDEITHLITISCTGFHAPGVDIALIRELGLPASVARTNVGFMGCHGAMNGLRVAKAYADADPQARVLVVALELCSLHQQYGWDPQRIVSNSLFADGAAAVIASGTSERRSPESLTLSSSFSAIIPNSEEMMSWAIGDNGFEMYLSAEVPDIIRRSTRAPLEAWLNQSGLSLAEIQSWAIHPGGPRILDACAESLSLDEADLSASRSVLSRFGNMSSPTVLFVLRELLDQQHKTPTLMLGFGPGLAMEAALFE